MLTPYPTDFPVESVSVVVAKLRKQADLPASVALHHGWHVLGYIANLALPDPPPPMGGVASAMLTAGVELPAFTDEQLADALDKHRMHSEAAKQGWVLQAPVTDLLPWDVLLPMVTNLLLNWIKSRKSAA